MEWFLELKVYALYDFKVMMGSHETEPGWNENEKQHKVTITKGYWMQRTEVTQAQWKDLMGKNPSYRKNDDYPADMVSWDEVKEFIEKLNLLDKGLNYRLPTEAEWEYAARAGTTTRFYFGNSISRNEVNHRGDDVGAVSKRGPMPVGSLLPNAWGLYDMHGNVFEWCEDWYGEYPSGHVKNPRGPETGTRRVCRGGSWYNYAGVCQSDYRESYDPESASGEIGFRLVAWETGE